MYYTKIEFYNQEAKIQYLDTLVTPDKSICKRLFNLSAPLEREKKLDLAYFDVDDFIEMYKNADIRSIASIRMIHRQAKRYVQAVTGEENLLLTTINDNVFRGLLNNIAIKYKYISTKQIDEWEDSLRKRSYFNPEDMFVIRAIFEGICDNDGEELFVYKIDDFICEDDRYYVITKSQGRKEISKKLYYLARECDATTNYYSERMIHGKLYVLKYDLVGDTIIKETDRKYISRKNVYDRLNKRFGRLKKVLDVDYCTLNNVKRSGIYTKIINSAKEKGVHYIDYLYDENNREEITNIFRNFYLYDGNMLSIIQREMVALKDTIDNN